LIQHIASAGNKFRPVYVDLRTDAGSGYNAGDLMRTIARKMKLDVDELPKKEAEAAKWLRDLRDWFIGELNDRDDYWWLIIDGISQIDPIQDVRDLICTLVSESEKNTDMLRLVLLGCKDEAILASGERVVHTSLEPFNVDDVREFIRAACRRASVSIDQTGLDEAVDFVMAKLPEEPRSRAVELCKKVDAVTRELLK
jgi:hypothetical protein